MLKEAIASAIIAFPPISIASETITVAINEYCPYICDSNTSKPHGLAISTLEHAFPPPEYTIIYKTLPHMRSRAYLVSGKITAYAIDQTTQDARFLYPQYFKMKTLACIYSNKKNSRIYYPQSLASFDNARVGLINYYIPAEENTKQEYIEGVTYINPGEGSAEKRALKMLITDRLDLAILPSIVSDYLIRDNHWRDLIKRSECYDTIHEETVLFNSKNPNSRFYAKRIDTAYRKLLENGQFKALVMKYDIKAKFFDISPSSE